MVGIQLDVNNQLYIPDGFAHGFQSLSNAHVIYLTNQLYDKTLSKGLLWNDNDIGIVWPYNLVEVSEQDCKNPSWKEYIRNLRGSSSTRVSGLE
jgi:dTDP-4-dehydrorhamnose 3,5-epimerase